MTTAIQLQKLHNEIIETVATLQAKLAELELLIDYAAPPAKIAKRKYSPPDKQKLLACFKNSDGWPKPFVSTTELSAHFPEQSVPSLLAFVNRLTHKGVLVRVNRGVYRLANYPNNKETP